MFKSVNPATGKEIGSYPELTTQDVGAKLDKAVQAFAHWRTTQIAERTALLGRIADQYDANKHRLARVATEEMGKTYTSSVAEVEKCAAGFRHYAEHDRQPLLAVEPLGLLAVDRDAVTAKQDVQPSIAEPPALLRQLT